MAASGVYVFRRNGRTAYVGRGDSNFLRRMRRSHTLGVFRYDRAVRIYRTTCPREAYRLECRLFHRHKPCDNQIHPAVPAGTNWRCPLKGCRWS